MDSVHEPDIFFNSGVFVKLITHTRITFLGLFVLPFSYLKSREFTAYHEAAMRFSSLAEICDLLSTILLVFILEDLLL